MWPHIRRVSIPPRGEPPSALLDIVHEDETTDAEPRPLSDEAMVERDEAAG